MTSSGKRDCGTQAGILDLRPVATCFVELVEKCNQISDIYKKCQQELDEGRKAIGNNETELCNLQNTVDKFGSTMDSLGTNLLQDNLSLGKMNTEIDTLRREIATKRELVGTKSPEDLRENWEKLNELRQHREKLELQLKKVNNDIDAKYEETFHLQEKICALKDLREVKREENKQHLELLQANARDLAAKKRELLYNTDNATIDMTSLYVSPSESRRLQTEIEDIRHQQVLVDRHIQMQLEERDFLRETANEILQRVFDLEKQVRKETGDHCWESALTKEPNWYPAVGTPTIWCRTPALTREQLQLFIDRQNGRVGIEGREELATSEGNNESTSMASAIGVGVLGNNRQTSV